MRCDGKKSSVSRNLCIIHVAAAFAYLMVLRFIFNSYACVLILTAV